MRDDEDRVVDAFCAWLERHGWSVRRKVNHVDVRATRRNTVLYAEVKGRTQATGTDVDTGYGQLLRRMRQDDETSAIFALAWIHRPVFGDGSGLSA
jgi:hypothetical protein